MPPVTKSFFVWSSVLARLFFVLPEFRLPKLLLGHAYKAALELESGLAFQVEILALNQKKLAKCWNHTGAA